MKYLGVYTTEVACVRKLGGCADPRMFFSVCVIGESRGSLYLFRTQRHKYTTILNSLTNCILNTEYFSFSIAPIEKE